MRRSLYARMVLVLALVASAAGVAAIALTIRGVEATLAGKQAYQRRIAEQIALELNQYALGHADWSQVGPFADKLEAKYGQSFSLVSGEGRVSEEGSVYRRPAPGALSGAPDAVIDPVTSGVALGSGVVGPWRLADDERQRIGRAADEYAACAARHGVELRREELPTGRVLLSASDAAAAATLQGSGVCPRDWALDSPTATERAALHDLVTRVSSCLWLGSSMDLTFDEQFNPALRKPAGSEKAQSCLRQERQDQLRPYVAPGALLYLDPPAARPTWLLKDRDGRLVLGLAALGVLAVTALGAGLLFLWVVRPVRAATAAVAKVRQRRRAEPIPVSPIAELAELGENVNAMAAELDRGEQARARLLSDVSHELRNPLMSLNGWIEAAQDGIAEPDAELLAQLHAQAETLSRLTEDLHTLAMADAAWLAVDLRPMDLDELAQAAVRTHAAAAASAGVSLAFRGGGEEVAAHGDPLRAAQALANVLANAIQYTPPGGVVEVVARRTATGGVVEVRDTGPGVADADLPRLFERLWRADVSRTRETGGSGLGLAIAETLIRLQHGRIVASTRVPTGLVVTIELPSAPPGRLGESGRDENSRETTAG